MRFLALVLLLFGQAPAFSSEPAPPLTVDELRAIAPTSQLRRMQALDAGAGFTAYLVAYEYAGLTLHAMIAVPTSEKPDAGYPVLVANHGYVPDPRRYGISADGRDSRPGDYYRSVPSLFASRGFLTVIPDYRGHNSSEGFALIDPQTEDSFAYYAEDVVVLVNSLDQLEAADTGNVFMWSHSMGGIVAARTLLATDLVRAASFWSTMDLAEFLSRLDEFDGPVNVHHATGDEATAVANSRALAASLDVVDSLEGFFEYDEADHFFDERRRETAADLDAQLFRSRIQ